MSKRISIYALEKDKPVLAGAIPGQNLLSKLILQIPSAAKPEPLFLDFDKVRVATGSYLREGIVYFKRHCRAAQPNVYPVVANVGKEVMEDLVLVLHEQGDAIVTCSLDRHNRISQVQIVGQLDNKQLFTIEAVREIGETDASTLAERYKDGENIGPTGWNNRLAALAAKGVLAEIKKGRGKTYRFVLELN